MEPVPVNPSEPPRSERKDADNQALLYRTYISFEDAGRLKQEWNDLACRFGDILCSFDWCEVWWQHFGAGRRLEIHVLRAGEQLVGVLPLFRETVGPCGLRLRTVRVLGCDYTVNTVGLAVEPGYGARFTHMLLERLDAGGAWDILQIGPLRSYNSVIECVAHACEEAPQVQTTIVGCEDAWDTVFPLPSTYEEFVAGLSGNARNDTRRRERRLREKHQVEVETVTRPEQVQPAMDALIRLHQKRWMDKGQPGQLREPAVQQFHRDLAQRLLARQQLVLLTLKIDGQIVAATYGYHFGRRVHGLFRGYLNDPQWQEFSLGRIMHCGLIRHAIERKASDIEDGRGIFDYKLRLGGQLHGERSLVAVHRGYGRRLRFWAALHAAYLVHVLYSRIWIDMIVPRLGIRPKLRRFYIRNTPLRDLFRRAGFRLFGRQKVLRTQCLEPNPLAGPMLPTRAGETNASHGVSQNSR